MRGSTRAASAAARTRQEQTAEKISQNTANSGKKRKPKQEDSGKAKTKQEKDEQTDTSRPKRSSNTTKRKSTPRSNATPPNKKPKLESPSPPTSPSPSSKKSKTSNTTTPKKSLADSKLSKYSTYSTSSPFPKFPEPTPSSAHLAHRILTSLHGPRERPKQVTASATTAGCGDSPSVLDALVRTILSQNTSGANSTRAKLSMDDVYGASDAWADIVEGGTGKLEDAIRCGGLANTKSKVIMSILEQVYEKHGTYSLDHLHEAPTADDAMKEMLSFKGVGPKTASCVVMFCLGKESFAVDTHVYRITGMIGWRPKGADREETQAHLEARVPGELKYALHVLMVGHGKKCGECRAGGRRGKERCPLRKAFEGKGGAKEEVEGEGEEGVNGEVENGEESGDEED
ncbi:MAG: hypothetical protein Q9227_001012 [Pyrenula ochraceoflavens]